MGPATLTCTPSRHFSGRSVLFADQNATLWAGWAIRGSEHRVFYSGDTAMHRGFSEIGARLGPLVQGRVLVPVHWGLFDLATHGWTEPVERTIVAARRAGVRVATPRPGGSLELGAGAQVEVERWWPELPFQTVEEAPCWSSGVDELLTGYR